MVSDDILGFGLVEASGLALKSIDFKKFLSIC